MNFRNLQQLVDLIHIGETGNAKEIAKSLEVSERMVYKYLDVLKSEFNVPLKYNHKKNTYYFTDQGTIDFQWKDE
jgi:predicted DNA-binding transcriptional regulator YafY